MKPIVHFTVTPPDTAPRHVREDASCGDSGPAFGIMHPCSNKNALRATFRRFVKCQWLAESVRTVAALSLALVLTACAIGSPPPDDPARAYVAGTSIQDMHVSSFEEQMLREINRVRRLHGLPQVFPDQHLNDLARGHAKSMLTRGKADHEGLHERFIQSGRHLCVENAAFYFKDPVIVVQAWLDSPGHKKNLLHPDITHVGLAQVEAYTEFFGCQ